ncbi:MAG: LysR family substrate-binding domain-containing protein, partial [Verrucomicrobia bacterium]|nr:LysR family substrate-binding domain-containing protein [Verrucomicrobiota bacterium]
RTKRTVKLSLPGRAFLPRAKEVVAAAGRASDTAQQIANGRRGLLRIGIVPPALTPRFAASFKNFHDLYPDIYLIVQQGGARPLRQKLEAMELDIIFTRRTSVRVAAIDELQLEYHQQLLAIPVDHPLASKDKVSMMDLTGARVLLMDWSSIPGYGRELLTRCERDGVTIEIDFAAHDLQTLIWLVSAGFGVCPYPASLAEAAPPGVVFREFSPQFPRLSLHLEWCRTNDSEILGNFIECFRETKEPGARIQKPGGDNSAWR